MSNQPNIKFIPLSFISSEQELKRQIANTIVFSYLTNIYPQTNLNSYLVGTQYGFTASSAESGTHQLVRITDINDGSVDWKTVPYCDCNSENNYLLKENDILVARTGGTTGKSFLVKSPPENAVFASYLIRLRTKKDVNIEFIHAFLNSYLYWSQISEMKSGSAQPNVNAEKLKTLLLPNCSFEVQNQIVELLKGGDFSEYPIVKQRLDDTLGNLERFKEIEKESKIQSNLLSKLRQAYLQEAVMGKLSEPRFSRLQDDRIIADEKFTDEKILKSLNPTNPSSDKETGKSLLKAIKSQKAELIKQGKLRKEKPLAPIKPEEIPFEIPDNWVWCRLGEIFKFIDYRGKTPARIAEGVRLISAKNIKFGFIDNNPIEFISDSEYDEWMVRGFPKNGDILFVTEGHTMGFVAMINLDFKYVLAQRTICFQPLIDDYAKFIFYTLMSPMVQKSIKNMATGSAAIGIQSAKLKELIIPLPPLSEQKAIVAKVEGLLGNISLLESENKAQQIEVQRLMGAVLQEAFGGR